MKTFIKYSGNKSKHISKFEEYFPKEIISDEWTGTYVEPFVGSGAVLLNLEPNKWIINDLNKDLVNVYKQVKNRPKDIIKFYKKFGDTFKKLSKKDKIIKCKDYLSKMSKMSYNFDRAKWYMLLKDIAYMGNIIVNNKFYFPNLDLNITVNDNYPFLKERKYDSIRNASEYFNKTKGIILNKDYREVLKLVKKGDFVFLDPPYIEEHNYQFNYNIDEKINDNFVETLLKEVKKLDTRGVKWMMTQSNTPFVRKVFKKYTIKTFQAYRRAKKGFSSEAVIMNYIPNSQNTKKSIKKVERKSTKKSKKKSTKKSKKKSTKKVERKSTKKIKRKSTKKSTKKIKRKSTKKVERKSTKKIFPRGLPKLPKKYTKNV